LEIVAASKNAVINYDNLIKIAIVKNQPFTDSKEYFAALIKLTKAPNHAAFSQRGIEQ